MTKNGLKLVGVASALTLSLAACGGDEDFDTPGGSSPTQTQDADQPEPKDTPSESDPSDSDDTSNGEADHGGERSEEHTSELQSRGHLVCRLLLEKKNR